MSNKVSNALYDSSDSGSLEIRLDQNRNTKSVTEGILLEWSELTYKVSQQKKTQTILNSVSGFANPGEMLAIMGSSGSGKTSLLSMLSNQLIPQRNVKTSGSITINGKNIQDLEYSVHSRYVMQQDILLPTFTPREALTFAATLKLKGDPESHKSRVEHLIKSLRLTKVADNLIGNEIIKGLSGGEKKRVSIALEMISEPQILILDEPTSGLDTFTANLVVGILEEQAKIGKTIVMTIHQPSYMMFEKFNRLILMLNGNFVYQGKAKDSIEYFSKIDFICPELTNPPDYYMRILFISNRNDLTEIELDRVSLLESTYKSNELKILSQKKKDNLLEIDPKETNYHAGLWVELKTLQARSWKNNLRNPTILLLVVFQAVTMGIITDVIFNNLGHDLKGIQDRSGVIFNGIITFVMTAATTAAMIFPSNRDIFVKDYKQGLYGVIPFFISLLLSDLVGLLMNVVLFSLITYFAIGLNTDSAAEFFIYVGVSSLIYLGGLGYGYVAGVISKNQMEANVWCPTIAASLMIFGSFYSKGSSMSVAFSWIKYLSVYYYGYTAIGVNEFSNWGVNKDSNMTPLEMLGLSGEIWENVGSLLLVFLGSILFVLIALKYVGEKHIKK